VQEIFSDYDPHFRAMSLDEAYMDITDYVDAYVAAKEDGISIAEALEAIRSNPPQQPRDFTPEQIAHRQQCAELIVNEMRARIFERTRKRAQTV
jgi:nucleotidyltransferase/DNA polymerase involved in DNA repair